MAWALASLSVVVVISTTSVSGLCSIVTISRSWAAVISVFEPSVTFAATWAASASLSSTLSWPWT